jgi:hypothetical protein
MDAGESWLPPAGRVCPAMQQWHGKKENSSEKVRPRDIVVHGKSDHCRQKNVPPCNSGMAEKKPHQKYSDPGKPCNQLLINPIVQTY